MNTKRNIIFSAVLLIASIFHSVSAQRDTRVVITPVNDLQAINVLVDLKEDIPYTVSLRDADGNQVWSEYWNKSVYAKSVMLDNLEDGTYRVFVASDNRYFQNTFTLSEGQTYIGKEQSSLAGPTVSVMHDAVLVDFESTGDKKPVDVTIYNKYGTEVFANEITTDGRRITRYDMSTLPSGRYDMVFKIDGKTFTKSVRIR